jgi:hypothetical protein
MSILQPKHPRERLTLLMTAIDAYAFPKLIPMTEGPFFSAGFGSVFFSPLAALDIVVLEGYGRLINHKFWTQIQGRYEHSRFDRGELSAQRWRVPLQRLSS